MNLNLFMKNGIQGILRSMSRFYLGDPVGRAFLVKMLLQSKKSAEQRERHEKAGTHIPPFLIASIASRCNLRCAGCYARAGGACGEDGAARELTAAQWADIFGQAAELGVSFILLAGGEPLMRRDILEAAAATPIVYPIFTNGTLLDGDTLSLFEQHRNLIPVLSIEGGRTATDARRGAGVYDQVDAAIARLRERGLLYGVSITVTKENQPVVMRSDFVSRLEKQGCGGVIYVEYVPVEAGSEHLVLDEADRVRAADSARELKDSFPQMVILSFPGDEEAIGGCLAAGRGFFHINPAGGAEPCPFSPYARQNLQEHSLLEVLGSAYFRRLRSISEGAGDPAGGCTLFQHKDEVEALLAQEGCF